ncbi:MAG: hypothetical protein Q7T33_05375 [Dehalococcoidia bacterium]|nr:hypothetical protein [Dehalococcoidia bacterium]
MDTATIAFGSALLGVVGGFVGALEIERRRVERTRIGCVRALASELRQNVLAAALVRKAGRVVGADFSSDTWASVRHEVAQFIPGGLFDRISTGYMALHGARRVAAGLERGTRLGREAGDAVGIWGEGTRLALNELSELPEARKTGVRPMTIQDVSRITDQVSDRTSLEPIE